MLWTTFNEINETLVDNIFS